jgi:hypothetical protein
VLLSRVTTRVTHSNWSLLVVTLLPYLPNLLWPCVDRKENPRVVVGMASGSSGTNQAFVREEEKAPEPSTDRPATAAKEKKHWSGVAYGENFEQTVDQLGARKDQSITVRLQRDASHGRSLSLEPTFDWKPDNPRADSKQQLEQCVCGAKGRALVQEKLKPGAKKQKQSTISFKRSTEGPSRPNLGVAPPPPRTPTPGPSPCPAETLPPPTGTCPPPAETFPPPAGSCQPPIETCATQRPLGAEAAAGVHEPAAPVLCCKGITVEELCSHHELPVPAGPVGSYYPFTCHTGSTPWNWLTPEGVVYASSCAESGYSFKPDPKGPLAELSMCKACLALLKSAPLKDVLTRAGAESAPRRLNNQFLSHSQMAQKLRVVQKRADLQRVKLWDQRRRISKAAAPIAECKQMVALLAQHRIPRVRELMARMHSRGASVTLILKHLTKAIDGTYTPRSKASEDDLDRAEHALIFGGPRLLYALQRTEGFLSRRTVGSARTRPRFITSWDDKVQAATVEQNLRRFLLAKAPGYKRAVFTLMLDDVAIEPRRRASPNDQYAPPAIRHTEHTLRPATHPARHRSPQERLASKCAPPTLQVPAWLRA